MSDCLAVSLVKQFNLGLLKPYAEILELCQEMVILIRSSADDIKSRESKYRDGLVFYQSGQIFGGALSSVGVVAGQTGTGIATAGILLSRSMKLSEAVHSLIKDLQNWKTRKRTESLIKETKIFEKLSAVFDKIDSFNGVNIRRRWRVSVGNGTLKTAVPDVDSDIKKRFREDPIAPGQKLSNGAMVNPKPNLYLKDTMQSDNNDVTPTVVKTTTGSWSVTSFLKAFFNVTLSWLGLWKKIANWMGIQKHDSTDLINTCEVLLSALVTVTRTVMETSAEIKIILKTHLSETPTLPCDHHHGNRRIVDFFTTAEELVQIEEFQQKMSTKPKK